MPVYQWSSPGRLPTLRELQWIKRLGEIRDISKWKEKVSQPEERLTKQESENVIWKKQIAALRAESRRKEDENDSLQAWRSSLTASMRLLPRSRRSSGCRTSSTQSAMSASACRACLSSTRSDQLGLIRLQGLLAFNARAKEIIETIGTTISTQKESGH
jgi:hypothetical protein